MTNPDPEQIAAGLTEALWVAMMAPTPNTFASRKGALRKLGLVEVVNRNFHAWTPLGLAVRNHLKGSDNG